MGSDLKEALAASYKAVGKLDFVGDNDERLMHNRTDIAKGATNKKLRLGVLGSTRGTALIPVIEACANGSLNAEIVAVVSNKSTAPILEKGKALGVTVTTSFVSSKGLSREEFDAECTSVLVVRAADVDLVRACVLCECRICVYTGRRFHAFVAIELTLVYCVRIEFA